MLCSTSTRNNSSSICTHHRLHTSPSANYLLFFIFFVIHSIIRVRSIDRVFTISYFPEREGGLFPSLLEQSTTYVPFDQLLTLDGPPTSGKEDLAALVTIEVRLWLSGSVNYLGCFR